MTEKQVSDEVLLIKFKAGNVGSYNKQIVFEKSDYISKLFNDKQNPRDFDTDNANPIDFKQSFNGNPVENNSNKNSQNNTPRNNDVSNNTSSLQNSNLSNNLSAEDNYDIHLHEIHREIFEDI